MKGTDMSLATTLPKARRTDPKTSHDAANSVDNITETKRHILKMLRTPKCDEQLVVLWKSSKGAPEASESGIRSRRAELVREGLVVDTGKRIVLRSGRSAIVWKAAK